MIYITPDGNCIATNSADIDILLVNYDHNSYLDYNTIE